MPITNVLAVVTVADIDSALAWYERLLGRPADKIPMAEAAEWHISEGGWIQLVRDADRAGSALLTGLRAGASKGQSSRRPDRRRRA